MSGLVAKMSYEKGFEDGGHLSEDGPALLSESLHQAVDSCLTLLRSVFYITSTPEWLATIKTNVDKGIDMNINIGTRMIGNIRKWLSYLREDCCICRKSIT